MTYPNGFTYHHDFLTTVEQQSLMAQLRSLTFTNGEFRGSVLKRSYAQYGYTYVSTGRKLTPAPPIPDFLNQLADKAVPQCPAGTQLNQCIITHYPPTAGIGWHTDAAYFGDTIIAISLNGPARLQFRPNKTTAPTHELIATPGSLYTMSGPARRDYEHRIVPVKADRYSITLRYVPATA